MVTASPRSRTAMSLQQASDASPTLAQLAERVRESAARRGAVDALIPPGLRAAVKAGPVDGTVWCLLVDNNAAAAKIRQLLPALCAHLRTRGWETSAIRLKVQSSR